MKVYHIECFAEVIEDDAYSLWFKVSQETEGPRVRRFVVKTLHGVLRSSILFAGGKGSNIADRGKGHLWRAYTTL